MGRLVALIRSFPPRTGWCEASYSVIETEAHDDDWRSARIFEACAGTSGARLTDKKQ
jgi:hypothetical protein